MSKNTRKSTSSRTRTYSTRGLTSAIRTFLSANPGSTYGEIASAMRRQFRFVGTAEKRISATLSSLFLREGVRRKGQRGSFTYYVRSGR